MEMCYIAMAKSLKYLLTPTDEGDNDNVFGGDFAKDNDQLLEHEDSLCSHPHDRGQGKVVDEH